MILETTADLKKYISVGNSFVFSDFEPYIQKAVNTFTKKYIGNLHITLADAATDTNAAIKNEAREHLRAALTNLGWFMYMPTATVMMDSSGIAVNETDNRKAANFWQIKDIRREVLRAGNESLDLLLEVLEANTDVFTDYATNYSTINNELLVNNAVTFSTWYNINNSRQTYMALQPTIRQAEDQFLNNWLCADFISLLKNIPESETEANQAILQSIKEPLQKALVNITVSKVAAIGLFELGSTGLKINFENYLGGRKQSVDYGNTADQIKALSSSLNNNATVYLKQAKQLIEDNMSSFTVCSGNVLLNTNTTSQVNITYDTKGIFGL